MFAARNESRQMAVYHWCAVQIQRLFRAFYSRKYRHDHAVRRAYLKSVEEKGDELRRTLQLHEEELQRVSGSMQAFRFTAEWSFFTDGDNGQRGEEEAMENINKQFEHLSQSTHYLVSTRAIPGVYNPPPVFAEVNNHT